MTTSRTLQVSPLTAVAFAAYGDVIEASADKEIREINAGNTARYHDLATLSVDAGDGHAAVSIFRSQPQSLPFEIRLMERHPLSSQAFYPLGPEPYLVVVAPAGELDVDAIRAFVASPGQGINYHPGTWHHYSLALNAVSDFLVIDRVADDENCDEVVLAEPLVIAHGQLG